MTKDVKIPTGHLIEDDTTGENTISWFNKMGARCGGITATSVEKGEGFEDEWTVVCDVPGIKSLYKLLNLMDSGAPYAPCAEEQWETAKAYLGLEPGAGW